MVLIFPVILCGVGQLLEQHGQDAGTRRDDQGEPAIVYHFDGEVS